MKYGVIYYKDTDNIGDDIQTYAATRFLPKIDYHIDRESLYSFIPQKKEYVKVIANAWYLHKKYTFPFSPYIDPLLIAMHFTKNDLITSPGCDFLKGYVKKSLKPYFPLGARDNETKEVLESLGYDTYFSGCMTLTIEKNPKLKKSKKEYICAVDLNDKCLNYLKENTNIEIKEMTHWTDNNYKDLSFDERMKTVEKYLNTYQNAKLVVTERLHVALPCLALGTPVILIYYENNKDRLETFTNYLNYYSEDDFLDTDIKILLKTKNSKDYLELKKNLISRVKEFIEKPPKDVKELPELKFYKDTVERINYSNNLFLKKIDELNKKNEKLSKDLLEKSLELDKKSIELDKINNSKSWKIVKRTINLKNNLLKKEHK